MGSSGGSMDQQPPTAACRRSWADQYEASGNKRFHTMSVVWYVSSYIDSVRKGERVYPVCSVGSWLRSNRRRFFLRPLEEVKLC